MLWAVTVVGEFALKAPATPPSRVTASVVVPSPTLVAPVLLLAEVSVSTSTVASPDVPVMLNVAPEPARPPIELAPVTTMFGSPDPVTLFVIAARSRARVVPASRFSALAPVPTEPPAAIASVSTRDGRAA